jgi:hypothetical protein
MAKKRRKDLLIVLGRIDPPQPEGKHPIQPEDRSSSDS